MFKKTFFVLCPSYHGATLLSTMLNSHPEISSLGDTYPSNQFDQVCGCGNKVSQCDFWKNIKLEVTASKFSDSSGLLPRYPLDSGSGLNQLFHSRFAKLWASPENFRRFVSENELGDFKSNYARFNRAAYANISEPGHVFIDGVKSIARVHALEAAGFHIDGIIHLKRSSFDYVSSALINSHNNFSSTVRHAISYRLYHDAAAKLGSKHRLLQVSYEDLCDTPDMVMKKLFPFLGVEPRTVEELQKCRPETWHFMGNSSLFSFNGKVTRKRHTLPRRKKIVIKKLTGVS